MNICEIKKYLISKHLKLDNSINEQLSELKVNAISNNNEELANELWCIQQIYKIQSLYLDSFNKLKEKQYEAAWNVFEQIEIEMKFLKNNYDYSKEDYNLSFIESVVKNYIKLFPYEYFGSREAIIKSKRCSICGKKISLRSRCEHKIGKLYMGEICLREITEFEFLAMAIVKNPLDKYTVLHIEGCEYNYGMLEDLMKYLETPYDKWSINEKKIKKTEYTHIGRNDKCPCGSGKKYKKCCMYTDDELMSHYKIELNNGKKMKETSMNYYYTWKK